MNRTTVFLGLAGVLALLALVIGVPRGMGFHGFQRPDDPGPRPTLDPPVAVSDGSIRMEARLSHPYIGTGTSDVFATIDLTGAQVPGAARSAVNLALVIDRSGSMAGEKLMQAKQAARRLVEQLGDQDRVSVIHFGSDVRTFAGTWASGQNKERLLSYIDGIYDEGGTNIGDGLEAGKIQLLMARDQFKVNRIILMSDGEPTEGVTEARQLEQLARQIRGQGVTLSAIGLGTDFNEDLMQGLAENGSGAYAYLRDGAQLATIFQKDLQQASTTVARDVSLRLELPEGVQLGDVLGYHAQQAGQSITIPMSDFSAGQVERVVVRLQVSASQAGKALDVTALKLSYNDLLKNGPAGAQARLSALVTDRAEEIAAHQDKQATVFAARAQSAANMDRAAEMLKKGDKGGARKLLQANEMLFNSAGQVAGPAAVAADVAEQQAVQKDFEEANDAPAVMHQVKEAKKKARVDYGRIGSTY
ncbi:MAG TPA: VWA domain-containing protein [Myxococcales bacterium]|nr:VWA domain-containing protein [Myxococcales bacterium]